MVTRVAHKRHRRGEEEKKTLKTSGRTTLSDMVSRHGRNDRCPGVHLWNHFASTSVFLS